MEAGAGTMVNNAVVSHNSVNELYYLEEVDSTNTWAKANLDKFGPVGAVYTTSQTAGRGRRGHTWINASGQQTAHLGGRYGQSAYPRANRPHAGPQ